MFKFLGKSKKTKKKELPIDYVANINSLRMNTLKPIIGGHLEHGITAMKSRETEMPTDFKYWIKIATSDVSEHEKYKEKLIELGFQPYKYNQVYFDKRLGFKEIDEINVAINE